MSNSYTKQRNTYIQTNKQTMPHYVNQMLQLHNMQTNIKKRKAHTKKNTN
jgi:hypothetical protein